LEKLSVPEAAKRLGVTQDAVRKRIHRNVISWEQDDDGRYYVYVDGDDTTRNTSHTTRQDRSRDIHRDPLILSLQDQIATLKRELEDRKEEARRRDTIMAQMNATIAELTRRVPELEPPREPAPGPSGPSTTPSEPRSDTQEAVQEEGKRRSWLYRFFFGP
jgi:hypothetical protein